MPAKMLTIRAYCDSRRRAPYLVQFIAVVWGIPLARHAQSYLIDPETARRFDDALTEYDAKHKLFYRDQPPYSNGRKREKAEVA
jgi:hypothetical protein